MKLGRITKPMGNLRKMRKKARGTGRAILAGAAGTTVLLGNMGKALYEKADGLKGLAIHEQKKRKEVVEMRKSTVVALMVALAAVAGVLGALYFYVLRREKELDEYEQLLFSEDFNDDLLDEDDFATEPAPEEA